MGEEEWRVGEWKSGGEEEWEIPIATENPIATEWENLPGTSD